MCVAVGDASAVQDSLVLEGIVLEGDSPVDTASVILHRVGPGGTGEVGEVTVGPGGEFEFLLPSVPVADSESDVYFAEMIIRQNGDVISVDARPSDSIALALRLQASIFADESLLEWGFPEAPGEQSTGEPLVLEQESDTEMAAEELQEYLRKLAPEDFGRFTP